MTNEIEFEKGDLIVSYGDLYNGYCIGQNLNSSAGYIGLYPTTKVIEVVVPITMPIRWYSHLTRYYEIFGDIISDAA